MMPTKPATDEIPDALLDMGDVVDAEVLDEHGEVITPEVIQPGNAVAVIDDAAPLIGATEWDAVEDGDHTSGRASIPLYSLNRKADGGFLNEDTGETVHNIEAVITDAVDTKAWWPVKFGKGGDETPACRSDDGITPNLDRSPAQAADWSMPSVKAENLNGVPPAPTCAECPNSKWDGDEPPACTAAIELLAAVIADETSLRWVRLRFGGMALSRARDYMTSFRLRLPREISMQYVTGITLEPEDTPNGTFLVPRFRRVRKLDFKRDAAPALLPARAQRAVEWRHAVSTDVRAISEGAVGGDGDAGAGPFDERPFDESDQTLGNGGRPLPDVNEKF